jgi:hypothetical protein
MFWSPALVVAAEPSRLPAFFLDRPRIGMRIASEVASAMPIQLALAASPVSR